MTDFAVTVCAVFYSEIENHLMKKRKRGHFKLNYRFGMFE